MGFGGRGFVQIAGLCGLSGLFGRNERLIRTDSRLMADNHHRVWFEALTQ
jgi:hypothetical protein